MGTGNEPSCQYMLYPSCCIRADTPTAKVVTSGSPSWQLSLTTTQPSASHHCNASLAMLMEAIMQQRAGMHFAAIWSEGLAHNHQQTNNPCFAVTHSCGPKCMFPSNKTSNLNVCVYWCTSSSLFGRRRHSWCVADPGVTNNTYCAQHPHHIEWDAHYTVFQSTS